MANSILLPLKSIFDDKGIKDAQKQFAKLGGNLKTAVGALGVGVGLAAVVSGLKDAAKAAVEEQKSQALLARQLKSTIGANEDQIASVEKSISSMSRYAAVADDEIRPAFASLVTATGSVEKATGLTSLALDLAAAKGISVQDASTKLAKAYNGQTKSLVALYPNLKKSTDIFGDLAKATKDAAKTAADADPFQRLNVTMGELQEQLGAIVLPLFSDFAEFMASADFAKSFSNLIIAIQEAGKALDVLFKGISGKGAFQTLIDVAGAAAVGVAEIAFWLSDVGTTIGFIVSGQWDKAGNQMGTYFDRYNKFVQGIYKEQDKAAKDAGKYVSPFNFDAYTGAGTGSGTKKLTDAQKALAKLKEEFKKYKQELKDVGATWEPMAMVTREIGKYETQIGDYFDSINAKIKEGIKAGTIANNKGAKDLLAYVATEKKALEAIGQQRDALTEKRSLAEALYDDVKAAITGVGSLTNLLDNESKSVTTTVTQIVNGLSVATSKTVEQVMGAKGYLGRLKDILSNTKAFAKQLTELKKLGLDKDLFKQIVDAGPEVGGQLATEILSGGEDSVKALNTTFTELQSVAAGVAEDTATVMFNSGVTVAGGLIAGLKSQEQALIDQANSMAAKFKAAFDAAAGNLQMGSGIASTDVASLRLGDIKLAGQAAGASAIDVANAKLAAQLINTKQYTAFGATSVVNLTVNAGAGVNGKQLGTFLKAELARVTKAGG